MDISVEKLLCELVFKVAEHFGINSQDALAAVALSKIANDLSSGNGNVSKLSMDQICEMLYREIANAE